MSRRIEACRNSSRSQTARHATQFRNRLRRRLIPMRFRSDIHLLQKCGGFRRSDRAPLRETITVRVVDGQLMRAPLHELSKRRPSKESRIGDDLSKKKISLCQWEMLGWIAKPAFPVSRDCVSFGVHGHHRRCVVELHVALERFRQLRTGIICLFKPYDCTMPFDIEPWLTKA